MAAPTVDALFRELDDHFASGEYESALSSCSKILEMNKEDKEGNHCRLVCLLHLSRFEEAKKELETNSVLVGMKDDLALETAYCFYRLSRYEEAKKIIESNLKKESGSSSSSGSSTLTVETKLRFLLAQVYYRSKDFTKAMSLYSEICQEHPSNTEAKCNLVAACAAPSLWDQSFSARCPWDGASASDTLKVVLEQDAQIMKSSHDFAYNVATSHISAGRFEEASGALEQAVSTCKETAKVEKWSESELNDEMNILNCQLAYLAQLQLSPEAEKMYSSVLSNKPSDKVVVAVANNNISTLHGNQNLFDSHHKLERNFNLLGGKEDSGLTEKLTPYQRHSITYNHALVLLKMGTKEKVRQAEEQAKAMKEAFPNSPFPCLLLSSIALRGGQVSASLELLNEFLETNKPTDPSTDFSSPLIRLAIAQIKYQQKNLKEAIAVLTESGDAVHFPGVTRVVVMLYMKIGELESAFSTLREASDSLRTRVDELGGFAANPRGEVLFSLKLYKQMLSSMAKFAMDHARYRDALDCYDQLLEIETVGAAREEHLLSKFVALAYVDPEQAAELEKTFKAPAEIDTSSVDVNALEALPAGYFSQVSDKGKSKEGKKEADAEEGSSEVIEKKKRKRKKKKLTGKRKPKGYTEGYVHPDPERWKPLKERSYYKRRRGRGANKEKLRGGHQGAGALEHLAGSAGSGSGSGSGSGGRPAPQAKGGEGEGEEEVGDEGVENVFHKKKEKKKFLFFLFFVFFFGFWFFGFIFIFYFYFCFCFFLQFCMSFI